jgi:hypothetical protein
MLKSFRADWCSRRGIWDRVASMLGQNSSRSPWRREVSGGLRLVGTERWCCAGRRLSQRLCSMGGRLVRSADKPAMINAIDNSCEVDIPKAMSTPRTLSPRSGSNPKRKHA